MHRAVYEEFERLLEVYPPGGANILELGAPAKLKGSLLNAVSLRNPAIKCVGVNLQVPEDLDPALPFEMVRGNANNLSMFEDESFDSVITNAMLEHDRAFWLTLAEVRRVLRPGGYFYVGVPGYKGTQNAFQSALFRLGSSRYKKPRFLKPLLKGVSGSRLMGTPTYMFHLGPHDYWRFSPQAVRRVFLEGMECLSLSEVLTPIRIVAVGRKYPATPSFEDNPSTTTPAVSELDRDPARE